jgi:hypothetical protein
MYAFDPEAGERRRRAAYDAANDALGSAGHVLGDAYQSASGSVGHALQHLGEHVAGAASSAAANMPTAQDASDAAHGLFHRAADTASAYRDSAGRRAQAWMNSARSMIPQRRRPTDVSGMSATAMAVGALAAGIGAMWLFDPNRGRSRRAWIGQKATRLVNETGDFFWATGRHLRNKSRGYAHDAGEYVSDAASSISDSSLVESVRSTLGRLGEVASQIRVDAMEGRIHLSGQCVTDVMHRILDAVRSTPGVRGIDNSLEVTDMYPNQSGTSA